MTILELIRAQCILQSIPAAHAERIEKISGITEEKDGNIIAAVKSFKENVLPAIEEAGKTADDAVKTAVAEYEKKHGLKEGKPIETKKTEDVEEKNELAEVKEMLQGLLKQQKATSILESVKLKLKGKMHDDFINEYAGRVNLEAENIDNEIEAVVKQFEANQQAFLNHAVASGNYQPVNGRGVATGDKDIDAFIESKTKDAGEGPFAAIKL